MLRGRAAAGAVHRADDQRVTALPPNMYRNFAAWLKIWSKQTPMKSTNISSATGRRPVVAAPTAAPMNAASVIGVSSTRSRNSCTVPW